METLLSAAEAPLQLLQGKAPRDRNSLLSRHQEITSTGRCAGLSQLMRPHGAWNAPGRPSTAKQGPDTDRVFRKHSSVIKYLSCCWRCQAAPWASPPRPQRCPLSCSACCLKGEGQKCRATPSVTAKYQQDPQQDSSLGILSVEHPACRWPCTLRNHSFSMDISDANRCLKPASNSASLSKQSEIAAGLTWGIF